MINIFSLSNLLLCTGVLMLSLFIVNWIIRPYKRIHSYRKEHITTEFFPVIGSLKSFLKDLDQKGDMLASIRTASVDYPNQKVLIANMNKTVIFMLRDPQYIKEFLLNQNRYHKEKSAYFLIPLMGTGLLFAEDEVWKRHRRIISGSFHYEFIKENTALIQQTTKEFLDRISPNDYKDFDVINRIQDITGEVVGRVFFGENLHKYTIDGKRLTLELGSLASDLCMCGTNLIIFIFGYKALNLPIPQFTKIMKRVRVFREKCFTIIQDRKNRPVQSKDLLASLLSLQNSQDPRERYSDEDIVNEFITFFIAGMETTGHLIGMSLYELTQYPQYLQELKEERDRTYNKEKVITTETLQKMDVLHSFFKETLRFYTPVPGVVGRCAVENHQLVDLKIKKGDVLVPHFFSVFFNSKYFKDPQEFSPARWRDPNQQLDAFAFTPFSAGPRNCIGQHMAILEAKTIVSEFLERFSFKVKEGYKLKMIGRFSYEPVDPLLFDLSPIKLE